MRGVPGKYTDVSERIIRAFFLVYNALGEGFSEKVYHGALLKELCDSGLEVKSEHPIPVYYHGVVVSTFVADLIVDECIIVELKAVSELVDAHRAQLTNYLKATTFEVGLLLNFGPKAEIERKVYDNRFKGSLNWTHDQPQHEKTGSIP